MANSKYRSPVYLVILAAVTLWCLFIVLIPVLECGNAWLRLTGWAGRAFFSPVCHQLQERSFFLMGNSLPVCARCSGIYAGFWLGSVICPLMRIPTPKQVWLAAAPMGADVLFEKTGLYASSNPVHGLTGLLAGCMAALIVVPALFNAANQLIEKRKQDESIC